MTRMPSSHAKSPGASPIRRVGSSPCSRPTLAHRSGGEDQHPQLENYVNEGAFKGTEGYAKEHPEYPLDTERATVWFDHLVVATTYIGPMAPAKK